jgi:hypothetical protein
VTHATTTAPGSAPSTASRLARRLGLTPRPETFGEQFRNSAAVWLGLMLYWAIADLIVAAFPPSGRPWPGLGAPLHIGFTLAGLAAIWCMHRVGIPAAWDARIPARQRLLLPLAVGVGFGFAAIGIELYAGSLQRLQAATGEPVTVGFPQSLLVYTSLSPVLELYYLLLPVSLLLWLMALVPTRSVISGVALRGRGQTATFWVLAVLASAIELAEQAPAVVADATAVGASLDVLGVALYLVQSFGFNLSAAALFRRYGLLAPILVRLGNYLVWHLLFGHLYLDRML